MTEDRRVPRHGYVIEDKDLTYTSYSGSGRQEALEILYGHGIQESLAYTINTIKEPTGRGGPRTRARTRLLNTFGAEAKDLIAMIKIVAPSMAQTVIDRAIQAHGGMGVSGDTPLAGFFAAARTIRLADGPDEVHMYQLGRNTVKMYTE